MLLCARLCFCAPLTKRFLNFIFSVQSHFWRIFRPAFSSPQFQARIFKPEFQSHIFRLKISVTHFRCQFSLLDFFHLFTLFPRTDFQTVPPNRTTNELILANNDRCSDLEDEIEDGKLNLRRSNTTDVLPMGYTMKQEIARRASANAMLHQVSKDDAIAWFFVSFACKYSWFLEQIL